MKCLRPIGPKWTARPAACSIYTDRVWGGFGWLSWNILYPNYIVQIRTLRSFYHGCNWPTGFLQIAVDYHHIDNGFSTPRLAHYFTAPKKVIRMRVTLKRDSNNVLHKSKFMVYCAMQNTDTCDIKRTNCELLVFRLRLATMDPKSLQRGTQLAFVNMRWNDRFLVDRVIDQYAAQMLLKPMLILFSTDSLKNPKTKATS